MTIGILALQGGFALHQSMFAALHTKTSLVKESSDLKEIAALVLPGGESGTILKNMPKALEDSIKLFSREKPVWGSCAGCILMASEVERPVQRGLGILNIAVQRNAYGAQNESFITKLSFPFNGGCEAECIFIRAPRITRVDASVTILATVDGSPVMAEQGCHMVTTFHPELGERLNFHRYFLKKCYSSKKKE